MQLRLNDAARRCARAWRVLAALPLGVAREVERLAAGRAGGLASLCEVRLRLGSPCEIILGEERLILGTRVGAEELAECVRRVSDGGLYAHRDTIAEVYSFSWSCRPHLAENSPLDCFPGARCPLSLFPGRQPYKFLFIQQA